MKPDFQKKSELFPNQKSKMRISQTLESDRQQKPFQNVLKNDFKPSQNLEIPMPNSEFIPILVDDVKREEEMMEDLINFSDREPRETDLMDIDLDDILDVSAEIQPPIHPLQSRNMMTIDPPKRDLLNRGNFKKRDSGRKDSRHGSLSKKRRKSGFLKSFERNSFQKSMPTEQNPILSKSRDAPKLEDSKVGKESNTKLSSRNTSQKANFSDIYNKDHVNLEDNPILKMNRGEFEQPEMEIRLYNRQANKINTLNPRISHEAQSLGYGIKPSFKKNPVKSDGNVTIEKTSFETRCKISSVNII